MKLLSRLTAVSAGLALPVVALTGSAYAKLPPEDPDTRPGSPVADDPIAPVAPVVQLTGFATWQVVALVLTAALIAAVLTVIATRLRPAYAKSAV
ncbi:hypothetical protein ACQPXM_36500 [Kribbella sp. CA-253562]|uniref:hypothetical protein n=1 Tax=Kribbella sp. CA-253562 TaxID=3239942 RepID=UPI003D8B7171